jgi:hypothetical protein
MDGLVVGEDAKRDAEEAQSGVESHGEGTK